jgi:hypothetical protein
MSMTHGNVRLATEGQLDELRLSVERAFNKLRGRMDFDTAQRLIFDSKPLDRCIEQLLSEGKTETPIAQAVSGLFVPVGTVTLCATKELFITAEKFAMNTKDDAEVKISGLGDGFCDYFSGLSYGLMSASEHVVQEIVKFTLDGAIISELGGTGKAKTALSQMFTALAQQGHGQAGPLAVDGNWNLFYVLQVVSNFQDKQFCYVNKRTGLTVWENVSHTKYMFKTNGEHFVLRNVGARFVGGGWYCDANPIENSSRWAAGSRVFSRKPMM